MVSNIIDIKDRLTQSPFGKAARQSAERIIRVGKEAVETSGAEGRKVFTTVRKEGVKLQKFAKVPRIELPKLDVVEQARDAVEQVQDVAADRMNEFEKAFQKRVDRLLKDLGIPTAKEVAALSRRVEELAVKVEARARRTVRKAPVRARRAAKSAAPKAEAA